ncbi:hypothetical protein KP509_27G033500 [Ceratopteris richardii]|uniref:Protein kinase domain-containing protein n=1 Tax=Ceratopteris richardii TaxID=49495 RepID=A0A8T2RGV9_CERRI|nr:hypothetical protein KP509_27G033500 [Ceratopteris richardii]
MTLVRSASYGVVPKLKLGERHWVEYLRDQLLPLVFSATIFFFGMMQQLPCFSEGLQFDYHSFVQNDRNLKFSANSNVDYLSLQVTRNSGSFDESNSSGQITYAQPLQLWSRDQNYSASFSTKFLMNISPIRGGGTNATGGGVTFMLSSSPAFDTLPGSFGEWLGLFDGGDNQQDAQRVGIEFDTFKDSFDPDNNHVGIDVNGSVHSIYVASLSPTVSLTTSSVSNTMGINTSVWIEYDGNLHILSVYLENQGDNILTKPSKPAIYQNIDLRHYLPEVIYVGFSASLGTILEGHCIERWAFNSTDPPSGPRSSAGLIIGLTLGGLAVVLVAVTLACACLRRSRNSTFSLDDLGSLHYGPRKFSYRDLKKATNGFADDRRLGQGAFGEVYKGEILSRNGILMQVAVKLLSRKSKQGEREFRTEIMSMGRMKHRHLVQLLGWSYEGKRLMLVYEYMPKGSLDQWLRPKRGGVEVMGWDRRYHVMKGVAAGLLYLHEEWEMVVIHRDLKPSNVMLDDEFNARIGDFGLAKFIDMQEDVHKTATIAGTPGYIAPECIEQGVVSKESDIYSLGAIAVELATGHRISASLLYSLSLQMKEGRFQEVADSRLPNFDDTQLEILLRLGLACCHPDPLKRPSIRQVMHALSSVEGTFSPSPVDVSCFSSQLDEYGISINNYC